MPDLEYAGIIKFSALYNAFLVFWLLHSISVIISFYTLVCPYMGKNYAKCCQAKIFVQEANHNLLSLGQNDGKIDFVSFPTMNYKKYWKMPYRQWQMKSRYQMVKSPLSATCLDGSSGLCSTRAQWPLAPNFCPRATRKSQIFHTNHMLGTLDFTVSEHWAPLYFP